ncbi:hypothetical protein OG937_45345 [Streptomyces sp. NBC_00510]
MLCREGEAVHTAQEWFARTAVLIEDRTRNGRRRMWREDAVAGLRPLLEE